jgi:Zn-dependent protease
MEISFCPPFIAYETTKFNNFLYNFAAKRRDELPTTHILRQQRASRILCCRQFYRCGAMMGLITSFTSTAFILYTLSRSIFTVSSLNDASYSSAAVLTPLVPGVNVPWPHMFYIFVGYAISTITHEFGHGLAMATVGVHIESVGWFIMCGLPGAYVSCDVNTIRSLKPHRALRVYFAGVWHNVLLVFAIFASLYVWQLTPVIPSLFYESGDGMSIVSINNHPDTKEWRVAGVSVGTRIISINDLPTSSLTEYENVLIAIMKNTKNRTLLRQDNTDRGGQEDQHFNINVRFAQLAKPLHWKEGPESLYHNVHVVSSRPGFFLSRPCSLMMRFCLGIPTGISLLLSYTASISGGLALINSLPVFWLDGDDALGTWLQLLLPKRPASKIFCLKKIILSVGTLQLLLVVMLSFFSILV